MAPGLARTKGNRRLAQLGLQRHGQFRDMVTRILQEDKKTDNCRGDIPAIYCPITSMRSRRRGLMAPIECQRLNAKRRVASQCSVSICEP